MKKIIALIMVMVMSMGLIACSGNTASDTGKDNEPKTVTMKVSVGVPDTHFEYEAVMKMKEYVEKQTNGTLIMEVFPSAQIGNDKEVFEGLPLGVAHMLPAGLGVISNFVPEYGLLEMPFLFDNIDEVSAVTDGEWGKELLAKLEDIGYIGLGFGDFGFRHTTNNVHPIKTAADFEGLKIRTMTTPIHLKVFEALGANPTPMAFSELFSALQQGVVDGQENPLMNIYSNKLHEVQKYITLDGHVFSLVAFVVSKDWYEGLDPSHQKALAEGAEIARDYMRQSVISQDAVALEKLKEYGIEITEMSPEAKAEMREITKQVCDDYGNGINSEFYAKLLDAIKAAKK